ncbi:glutaredoxin family protein [Porticoccus sp. W117]|uniref:glutaredoxin family protein n=1 Tax=Porticoccus sp. W117 TaxID=3054777 RepID=UPI002595152A|nr:glutaredoxin family protein [Porticoccus sp. W117]MDM3871857.1 glutaredoxin family protein [Porticoccus sp. W117]
MTKQNHWLTAILLAAPLVLTACNQAESVVASEVDKEAAVAVAAEEQVVIYSAEWCGPCKTLKRSLDKEGVAYTDYDVDHNEKALEEFLALGGHGLPTTVVGEQVILGDNPQGVIAALESLNQ